MPASVKILHNACRRIGDRGAEYGRKGSGNMAAMVTKAQERKQKELGQTMGIVAGQSSGLWGSSPRGERQEDGRTL